MNESSFVNGLAREVDKAVRREPGVPDEQKMRVHEPARGKTSTLKMAEIFECFSDWCELSDRPIVLIIDEVDMATNVIRPDSIYIAKYKILYF